MAAAKLVTRCPACRTAFRLVADQLRLRQGLVRCGHCETVFDAREHLIEVPAPAASAAARSPQPSRGSAAAAPVAAPVVAPDAETEATPASSATHFDPGYDPGYDVPALDSPTMMFEPTEEEEACAEEEGPAGQDADAASTEPASAAEDIGQPELGQAMTAEPGEADGAHAAQTPSAPVAPSESADPTQAEAPEAAPADAEPAPAERPDASPVVAANGRHHVDEADQASAAIVATREPWPTLDRTVLEGEDPSARTPAPLAAKAPDELADAPADPAAAEPVLRSASEFLRAQSSDSAEAQAAAPHAAAEAAASETPDQTGDEGGDESGHDYGRNFGPTYGPSGHGTGDAFSATAGAIARENVARRWARQEPQLGPSFSPDFLRQARERERERAREAAARPAPPRLRYGWHIAAGMLAIGVVLQGVYLMRGQLAGQFPALRPMLESACRPLGCEVPPWRDIDALRIDTSQLQKQDEGSDAYVLAVTLRNQGRATTALPAIELVMTDLQDQLLLRRVLEPSEYLEPAQKAFARHGLRAGTELPVRVRFRTQQAAANYRVLIFYP